jgi:hypothetical protein
MPSMPRSIASFAVPFACAAANNVLTFDTDHFTGDAAATLRSVAPFFGIANFIQSLPE